MRTNHILVDYENVQTLDFGKFRDEHFMVWVFLGDKQVKLPTNLVIEMQKLGNRAEFVQLSGSGPNALDFTIAYTIGRLSERDPTAFFHVLSKDTGFDPLIQYLKCRHIQVKRHEVLPDLVAAKPPEPKTPKARADAYWAKLGDATCTKPGTRAKLENAIKAHFPGLTDAQASAIMQSLLSRKLIAFDGEKVSYPGLTAP